MLNQRVAHKRMESDLNYSYPRKIEQIWNVIAIYHEKL